MSDPAGLLLGIDVGGTKIAGLAVDAETGTLAASARRPIDDAPLHRQVAGVARDLLEGSGRRRIDAIGVAVPGLVDGPSGVMRLAVNVDAAEVAIGSLVADAVGAPCFVEHDARAAALWIRERAADPGASFAYLSVGTGISAAVVIEGHLVRGVAGLAGEIGHTQAVLDGPPCSCGLHGCLEAVAAGPAVARLAAEGIAAGRGTSLSAEGADAASVFRAAAAGDPLAAAIAARTGTHLAQAIRGLVLLFGIRRIVLGGGLSRAGEPFLRPILEELERERVASPLMGHALSPLPIDLLPPDSDPGAWGAVVVAREGLGNGIASVPWREVTGA